MINLIGLKLHNNERGETLIEITLALAILSMVLFTTFNLVNNGTKVNELARQRTQVDNFLQQQAEALRNYRDNNDWNGVFACHASCPNPTVFSTFHMVPAGSGNGWVPVHGQFSPSLNGAPTLYKIKISTTTVTAQHLSFNIQATWQGPDGTETTNLITNLVKLDDFRPADCSAGCP